ncbi:MAG: AraC family transcriptional regulator [Clostridiales bacterium]|jgi:AraC-like DNA-binding protein|nr:AraC family transcriptional regulator [Clostridiales bacterium]MDR2749980.1 AraC family transcriptional regulator [Clostridiales bacterium]
MLEYVYSPHYDFYIDKAKRTSGYDMKFFHFHKKYEVYLEVEGTRRYFIGDNAYIVNAGNIVLIEPDSVHKTASVEDMPHTRYVLNFNQDYLACMADALDGVDLLACFSLGVHVLQVSPRKAQAIESLMAKLWESRDCETPSGVGQRKLVLSEMLLSLGDYIREQRDSVQGKMTDKTVEAAQTYIASHFAESLSLDDIAGQVYVSRHYLSRLFKKRTGLSVVEYVNSIRLTAAKGMLETSGMKIGSVAEACGYGTTAHFSRMFKEATGFSPQHYRKLYNKQ